jgi:hypothetical protein
LRLSIFGSLLGFTAYAYCLNELPAGVVGTYAYVNPVVALALGYVILDEPLSASLLSGAALILLGVLLTTSARSPGQPQPASLVDEPSTTTWPGVLRFDPGQCVDFREMAVKRRSAPVSIACAAIHISWVGRGRPFFT